MGKKLSEMDLYGNYLKWGAAVGPFRCFYRSTNFVSLKHYPDFEFPEAPEIEMQWAKSLCDAIRYEEPESTLFMVDLPGIKALQAAWILMEEKGLWPVLTFNNVLHPSGLVGGRDTISLLLGYGEKLSQTSSAGYVLVLDSQRYGEYTGEELRRCFNNQYELGEEDLPPLEMLQDLGFERVVYLYCGKMKEDTLNYLAYLEENRMSVVRQEI